MNQFGLVFIAAMLVAGCATVHPPTVTRPSPASSDERASVPPAGDDELSSYIKKVRTLSLQARPARVEPETAERSYPALAEALARVSADPTAESRTQAGDAYRAAGILDQALTHYSAAAKLAPQDGAAWDGMARIWRDWGLPGVALGDASRAVYFAAGSAAAHNTLGTILQSLGRLPEARGEFQRALALDPGAAYALNNLCYSWFSEGRGAAGAEACRQALALAPDMAPARNNLALAFAVQGDLESARREFAFASDAAATDYNLGIVYMAQGRFREAADAFTRAASRRPGLPFAIERARQARRLADARAGAEHDDDRR